MIRGLGPLSGPLKPNLPVPEPATALGPAFALPDDALDPRADGDRRDPDGSLLAGAALGARPGAHEAAHAVKRDQNGGEHARGRARHGGQEPLERAARGARDGEAATLAAKNAGIQATEALVSDDGLGGTFVGDDAGPPRAPEAPARDARAADGAKAAPPARGEGRPVSHEAAARPVPAPAQSSGEGKGGGAAADGGQAKAALADGAKNTAAAPNQQGAQAPPQGGGGDTAQAGALGLSGAGSLLRLAGMGGGAGAPPEGGKGVAALGELDPRLGPDAMASAAARGAAAQKVVPVTPGQPLADQLADAVRDLVDGDGGGDLIRFEAKGLGRFTALVQHDGRGLLVHLHADDAATRALLHERLPEVRAALERAGLGSGVDVRADGGSGGGGERHPQAPEDGPGGVPGAPGARRGGVRHAADGAATAEPGRLHLIV